MSVQLDLLAWNGDTFDLRNGPVRVGAEGTSGVLKLLKLDTHTRQAAGRDGQVRTGYSAPAQTLSIPVKWGGYTAEPFESVDSRLWAALDPTQVNTLRVRDTVRKSDRTCTVRLDDDGYAFTDDPTDMGIDVTTLQLVADDPWWKGVPVVVPFGQQQGAATPFYGASGFGPPFYLAGANAIGQQSVVNPGQAPAYPLWTLAGPVSSFVLTVDGSILDMTAANLMTGEILYIDSDPTVLRAWRVKTDGTVVEETQNLATWGFATIARAATSTVKATLAGTGTATLSFVPRYLRAA